LFTGPGAVQDVSGNWGGGLPRVTANVAHMFANNSDEAKAERARQVPMHRMGMAWEVANACAFLASDAAGYITGTELVVAGGLVGKYV